LWLLRIEIKSVVLYCKFIRPGCNKENYLAFKEVVTCYNDSKENCYSLIFCFCRKHLLGTGNAEKAIIESKCVWHLHFAGWRECANVISGTKKMSLFFFFFFFLVSFFSHPSQLDFVYDAFPHYSTLHNYHQLQNGFKLRREHLVVKKFMLADTETLPNKYLADRFFKYKQ
jgi:hypothetical protein